MKNTESVKNTYMGMHITLNFAALKYCRPAHTECMDFWERADSCIAIFLELFSQII